LACRESAEPRHSIILVRSNPPGPQGRPAPKPTYQLLATLSCVSSKASKYESVKDAAGPGTQHASRSQRVGRVCVRKNRPFGTQNGMQKGPTHRAQSIEASGQVSQRSSTLPSLASPMGNDAPSMLAARAGSGNGGPWGFWSSCTSVLSLIPSYHLLFHFFGGCQGVCRLHAREPAIWHPRIKVIK